MCGRLGNRQDGRECKTGSKTRNLTQITGHDTRKFDEVLNMVASEHKHAPYRQQRWHLCGELGTEQEGMKSETTVWHKIWATALKRILVRPDGMNSSKKWTIRSCGIWCYKHGLLAVENESTRLSWNVTNQIPSDTASHPRRADAT